MKTIITMFQNILLSPFKGERGGGLFLSLFIFTLSSYAQPGTWDREKYPDLPNPKPTVNMKAAKKMIERMKKSIAAGNVRPDHLNNALKPSFPPIINQSGGSCGAASSIYYQFTNQINTARFVAADNDEHRYATHFPWMLNTNGTDGTGYDRLGRDVGIASCAVYGGTTYSRIYGRSGQDDQDDDCGWMQGYDSWYATMHNRIVSGNSFPFNCGTEEGRELVKNYLWNRCGDDSFASGGICGIGVAAGPFSANIPKTAANDAAGVTGMKYITDWNETYNHAMTIVGYDDRLEFDLDGNGVIGEAMNADGDCEVGAWIIANSWGDGWENNGFIYCPYERSNSVKGWPKENSFTPGYYDVMRDYRPLRTIKVKMEYSHRSEICLHVGVAQDVNATKPEQSITLTHFNFAGDGNRGKTQPAPEIPMLGRWADGELHTEPMEFGYDLTTLTKDFDLSRPLKYFFWVETRSWGVGEGKIHAVSIIDYNLDHDGVEVPFPIAEPIAVPSAGQKTEMTAVVSTDCVPEPRNLAINGNELTWDAPSGSRYEPASYKIYKDGSLYTTASTTTASIEEGGAYTVSAVYQVNGYDAESKPSAPVVAQRDPFDNPYNRIAVMSEGSKLVIPYFAERSYEDFTIEFWMWMNARPTAESFGFRIKADTTQYFFKVIKGGYIEVGNDGGSYTRSDVTLSPNRFYHIAIVNEGLYTRLYINGVRRINWSNSYSHRGIKGPARIVIGETEGTTANYKKVYDAPWNGFLDELRFWDYARSANEIKASFKHDVGHPRLYGNLLHYYNMDAREEDGTRYLIDGCGRCDAEIVGDENALSFAEYSWGESQNPITTETTADFTCATTATVGKPFPITNMSDINTASWGWEITGPERSQQFIGTVSPVVVFTEPGEHTISLQTVNLYGNSAHKTATVNVTAAALPTVDFIVPEGDVSAGEHVTFVNTSTPIEAANYEWQITGAENPIVKTVNAAATFSENGTYDITLTAYNTEGSTSVTKSVSVGAVRPEAAFSLQNNVILKGEQVDLIDESKYNPTAWTWDVASDITIYRIEGKDKRITLNTPGIYDVTLTAVNAKGSDKISRSKAIIVCNADGKNSLHFDGVDDLVEAASPFTAETTRNFSIEWWMLPGRVTDNSFHIGDKASTMQIYVKPTGELSVDVRDKNITSDGAAVIFDEWHHYAVTFKAGTVAFYRDGNLISQGKISGVSNMPALDAFTIGGTNRPFNGLIDELRVWDKTLTQNEIVPIADEPVQEPAANEALLLYYDFNHDSGDVIDRSSHGLNGTRKNFGPDGDAWESSFGIFCLNPSGATSDVTAQYLKNYKHPFKTNGGTVNPANSSRYLRLLMNNSTSPWKQLNTVKKGSIYTEWHVDAEKNNYLTLEDTYSGFESVIKDLMIFQTVELPAGEYTFTADRDGDTYYYNWLTDGTYIAAAAGEQLPLTEDLDTEALASSPLSTNQSVSFMLEEPTKVSLGLIANMTDKKCVAVGKFILRCKTLVMGDGSDYDGICQPAVTARHDLQANGGLGCINIRVDRPQRVVIADLSGKQLFADWLDYDARIPVRRGIYIVNNQKVVVR